MAACKVRAEADLLSALKLCMVVLTSALDAAHSLTAYAIRPVDRLVWWFARSSMIGKFYGPRADEGFDRLEGRSARSNPSSARGLGKHPRC